MSLSDTIQLSTREVKAILPHRYPFLLVDKVLDIKPQESILAQKNISISDPIFEGHFPDNPIYPGVLLIEGLAQTSGILGRYEAAEKSCDFLLTEISQARFRKKIVPGDVVYYKVEKEKRRGNFYWFIGNAIVNNEKAVTVNFSAYMK